MKCHLCQWLEKHIFPPEMSEGAFWVASYRWESDFAAQWEPWEEHDGRRERENAAAKLVETDPLAALSEFRELADEGSVFSMRWAGALYCGQRGIDQDCAAAEDYFRRALSAGSWMATISYAELLFRRGAHDKWPSTLGEGVDKGFLPANFWLAWYHYEQKPGRKTARAMRPVLDVAAKAGHPGARLIMAKWTASGKFGLRHMRQGFRMVGDALGDIREGQSAADDQA